MRKAFIYVFLMLMVSSCYLHLDKRHYKSGYNLEFGRKSAFQHSRHSLKQATNDQVKSQLLNSENHFDSLKTSQELLSIRVASSVQSTDLIKDAEQPQGVNRSVKKNALINQRVPHSNGLIKFTLSSTSFNKTQVNSSHRSSDFIVLTTAFLSIFLIIGASVVSFKNSLSRLSNWGKRNKYKALSIVVMSQLVLAKLAIICGEFLHQVGYSASSLTEYLFSGILTGIFLSRFFIKRKSHFTKSYVNDRLKYGATLLTFVMLMVGVGNRIASGEKQSSFYGKITEWHQKKIETQNAHFDKMSKQNIQAEKVNAPNAKYDSDLVGFYVFLIILSILLGLLFICVAACSDSTLGSVAAVGVILLCIVGVVLLAKAIKKQKASKIL